MWGYSYTEFKISLKERIKHGLHKNTFKPKIRDKRIVQY